MEKNLDCTMELSLMEEAEMQIIMEDCESLERLEVDDDPIAEYYDERDDLEVYDEDEMNDFLAQRRRQEYEEADDEDYYESRSAEWTEEDSWWALTDGMYGEYPRNPIAFDAALEAMGY